MAAFAVTYSRVNEREAMQGGTDRHGFESQGECLRDAIDTCNRFTSSMSERTGSYADCSDARQARWFTLSWREWESGDDVDTTIHFPANATPASRARLVRLLQARA